MRCQCTDRTDRVQSGEQSTSRVEVGVSLGWMDGPQPARLAGAGLARRDWEGARGAAAATVRHLRVPGPD